MKYCLKNNQEALLDMSNLLKTIDEVHALAITKSRYFKAELAKLEVLAYDFYDRYMAKYVRSLDWKMDIEDFFEKVRRSEECEICEEYGACDDCEEVDKNYKYDKKNYDWFKSWLYGYVTGEQLKS